MLAIAFAVVGTTDLLFAQLMMAQRRVKVAKILAAFGAVSLGLALTFFVRAHA